ncbi:hypothetical protein MMARJ_32610 [Mycobacterium marseillense]|uniref:Uncharacterized protein n=1 Tax=Mycobacterium marseillense TaxID=701042 RepID=A0ABM7JF58_9MYCO|nr:hypothetical protein MMARJ_32610 [Mycobacterium marseillense]
MDRGGGLAGRPMAMVQAGLRPPKPVGERRKPVALVRAGAIHTGELLEPPIEITPETSVRVTAGDVARSYRPGGVRTGRCGPVRRPCRGRVSPILDGVIGPECVDVSRLAKTTFLVTDR